MKKRLILFFSLVVIVFVVLYLAGSFITGSFDSREWSEGGGFFIVATAIVFSAMVATFPNN